LVWLVKKLSQFRLFADRAGSVLYQIVINVFASLLARKFSGGPWLSKKRDLLAPRRQERQVRNFNFFAAPSALLRTCFAPLREIFRVLVAAPPRYNLCGDSSANR
jgi:hypothetical protein